MSDFAWLASRPIAHRGLHNPAALCFENTLSAARRAVDRAYAIECDVQRSSDGEAMVFHDDTLERLTGRTAHVGAISAATLGTISVCGTADRIPTLSALLTLIDGRTPLICEVKSGFDGDMRLTDRVAAIAGDYPGPLAIKSFDPAVLVHLRTVLGDKAEKVPVGIVAESTYDDPEWSVLPAARRRELAALTHIGETRPDFLSYWVRDLPHAAATLFRAALRRPVVSWTVRTQAQCETAAQWADQIVFEGFEP